MNSNHTTSLSAYLEMLHRGFERQWRQTAQVYQLLPVEDLQKQSASNGWSIAQCLDHLNSYYRHYLPLIKKQIAESPDQRLEVFRPGWLGKYLCNMIDPKNSTKKYKALAKHQPIPDLDCRQVVAEFIGHTRSVEELLKSSATKNLKKIRIQTSIHPLISMRLGDTLRFLLLHNERHLRQAGRNIQAPN